MIHRWETNNHQAPLTLCLRYPNQYIPCRWGSSKTPLYNQCPGYDTKQSDGEVLVMLELWGMQSTPSSPSIPGPLWLEVVAPDLWVK